jgi:hypothetical protein
MHRLLSANTVLFAFTYRVYIQFSLINYIEYKNEGNGGCA